MRDNPRFKARLGRPLAGRPAPPLRFLEAWKTRAAVRLERLKTVLSQEPAGPERTRVREAWLERVGLNIATRVEWLEVRLEHARAIQEVVREAEKRSKSPRPSHSKSGSKTKESS
jgi:hypothetical protein